MKEDKLVYLNYWSKLRNDSEKEIKYNTGRTVTKILLASEYAPRVNLHVLNNTWHFKHKYNTIIRAIPELYTSFKIPKHSGGFRTITAPCVELKNLQTEIVKAIEKDKWLPSNNAHGFVKNRNCKTALQVHQKHKSRWFLKIDIHDFFGSTTKEMLRKAFSENAQFSYLYKSQIDTILDIVTLNDVLPQGAPTSPMLCNIVMNSYDYKIQKYCHNNGLIYTRYADDILISSRVDWDWKETLSVVRRLLAPYTIAENKVRYGNFNGRNWNLGIMYTNNYKLTVGHKRKHDLKCAIHNFCTKPETQTPEEYYKLQGQLAYCKYIEPDYEWFSWAQIELTQFKPEPTLTTATEQSIVHPIAQTTDTELPFV